MNREQKMRTLLVFVMLAVSISFAQAQDAAQAAQQQAVQQALINSQIAQQNAQQAIQQAQQAAQTFQQAAQSDPAPVCCSAAGKPRFSVKSGNYASAKTVRITDSTRGAIIYFTTNGWTPTTSSNRYMGPITIPATTTLQAIAVFPYYGPYG
jgi:hemolysin activation/secretion protein